MDAGPCERARSGSLARSPARLEMPVKAHARGALGGARRADEWAQPLGVCAAAHSAERTFGRAAGGRVYDGPACDGRL